MEKSDAAVIRALSDVVDNLQRRVTALESGQFYNRLNLPLSNERHSAAVSRRALPEIQEER